MAAGGGRGRRQVEGSAGGDGRIRLHRAHDDQIRGRRQEDLTVELVFLFCFGFLFLRADHISTRTRKSDFTCGCAPHMQKL
jgi:hypothetical protein